MLILNNINNNYVSIIQHKQDTIIKIIDTNNLTKLIYTIFNKNKNSVIKKIITIENSLYDSNEIISFKYESKITDSFFVFVELFYNDCVINCYGETSYNEKIKENIEFNIIDKLKENNDNIKSINLSEINIEENLESEFDNVYYCSDVSSETFEEEDESEDEEEDSDNEEEDSDNEEEEEDDDNEEEDSDNEEEEEDDDDDDENNITEHEDELNENNDNNDNNEPNLKWE